MSNRIHLFAAVGVAALILAGCQSQPKEVMLSQKGAVELRAMQGRMFETGDRAKTIRTVIATLQDLGYSIEKVEAGAGTISARKLNALQMTVTVFPRGDRQMVVRANAIVSTEAESSQVDAPEFYQQLFFEPLSKALFLAANQDDYAGPAAPVASPPKVPEAPSPPETKGTKS